jgi:hypothetical protein
MTNKTRLKQLQNRVRYLEKTKSEWKQKAIALKAEVNRLQSNEKIKVKPTETVKKNAIDKTLVLKGKNDFDTIPFHHKYSIGHVMLLLSFVLTAASSMRGAVRNLEVVKTFFQLSLPIPSWYCIRLWLQRVGYYKLNRAKELANDWVWIVDHTIQLGSEKAFFVLGIRLCNLPPQGQCLKHEDVEPITLSPVTQSNGEVVYDQLEKSVKKTGIPRAIVGDYGSDLKAGVEKFCREHPETNYLYDIKHKTANVLKRELQEDGAWEEFTRLA